MTDDTSLHIPGVGAPLRSALAFAGFHSLDQLNGADYRQLLSLHGVGAKGLNRVLAALRAKGGDMSNSPTDADIEAATTKVTITKGHTGKVAKDIKTRPTDIAPEDFIRQLTWPRRIDDGLTLLDLFDQVTGEKATMWGPTMVGYGEVHYKSDSGREGDWFAVGFSPRKASLSLYGLQSGPHFAENVARLGPHKLGVGCLYVTNLAKVDLSVLRVMIAEAWERH
ncbi:DUF1801 domain-containing protein [Schaalia suimastitidis]|uniref:DUF1801 domain-containing protein n=1 Tax=Schaalia suimastitidis TaxID=121163 RepID=UPI00040AE19F|nr:DUF1801 domain-containing protein [Schaalia suimastitidis]